MTKEQKLWLDQATKLLGEIHTSMKSDGATGEITEEQVDEIAEKVASNFTTDLLYDLEFSINSGNIVEIDDFSIDEDGLRELIVEAINNVLGNSTPKKKKR